MNPNQLLQRIGGIIRRTARISERLGRRVASDGYGLVQRARHIRQAPKPGMDDVTLTRKAETEMFRGPDPAASGWRRNRPGRHGRRRHLSNSSNWARS